MLRRVSGWGVTAAGLAVVACLSPQAISQTQAPAISVGVAEAIPSIEDKYAVNSGVRIHYEVSGEGPLIVLVHGFGEFSGSWDTLTPALSDAYRVAAMDLRGYNLSDQPDELAAYAMPNLVADVAAVIAAEKRDRAIVIGHDLGAAIAWEFAFAEPGRLDGLVILSMPHPAVLAEQLATNFRHYAANRYAREYRKAGSERTLTAEGLSEWVIDPASKASHIQAFGRSSFNSMMNYYRADSDVDDGESTPTINLPLLILHGMSDAVIPASGHDGTWKYVSSDSAVMIIPGAGHHVQQDAPELVNQTIRSWLDLKRE